MCEENQTQVSQIRLLGFQSLSKYKTLLFILFILIYVCIQGGNLLIILVVTVIDHLRIPMFFFLKHLSIADVLLTNAVVPMMLHIMLFEEGILTVWGCLIQLHFVTIFGLVQCFLIVIMSLDRYLAICHPLQYPSIMSPDLCLRMVIVSWFLVNVMISSEFFLMIQFSFCGLNSIDHFFCDVGPVIQLVTSDTSIFKLVDFAYGIFIIIFPFVLIITSYICIFFAILKISSNNGRKKAFSTCSSHLITVCVYYGTLIAVYMTSAGESTSNTNKYRSMLYLVGTPLMNPIIYSLRNNKIKEAMQKMMKILILRSYIT
ncbi:olfactory receptor 1468-like [Anomaloglossus baeobatrachus]